MVSTKPNVANKLTMGVNNLQSEFRRFTLNSVQLLRLYSETLKALNDISGSGVIPIEYVRNLEYKVKDVQKQLTSVGKPPCIIVLGQNCRVRAILVNELFGQPHLPVLDPAHSLAWRTVRFKYSKKNQVLLTLGSSYELVENLQDVHWKSHKTGIKSTDLTVPDGEAENPIDDCAVVEMHLEHPLLYDNVQVVIPATGNLANFSQIMKSLCDTTTPIVLFGIADEVLSNDDIYQLHMLRSFVATLPIFFVHMLSTEETSVMTEADRNEFLNHGTLNFTKEQGSVDAKLDESTNQLDKCTNPVVAQLKNLGLLFEMSANPKAGKTITLSSTPPSSSEDISWMSTGRSMKPYHVNSEYIKCLDQFPKILPFVRNYLQSQLISSANHLYRVHAGCLQMFILSAFEMAREMQITPKRIVYARQKETELLGTLMKIAEKKQDEMGSLIADTIAERREDILQKAEMHHFKDPLVKNWEGPLSGKLAQQCVDEIRELVVLDLNNIIAQKLINSVYCLHDTFLGTLERCISQLEKDFQNHTEEGGSLASVALKQILTAAYQVEVPNSQSASILRGLYDKMKQLINSFPWSSVPSVGGQWRRVVASDMLDSLCHKRLARAVCAQLRERLRTSHENFISALKQLELHHNERLEKTGEQGFRLRKLYAPRLARLALETSSIIDCLLYGMPQIGREIGRGQYGVVYSCSSWAGYSPCAVKSVVPMDDKHWNDLAMEYYYMRSIPDHERIVSVRGSVIDHSYAGGPIPAVLIVMDRQVRDLYCALKLGLPWLTRLQVALDVVSGIRFLHSQGLVHRDIKLKNILLDTNNRAKLIDLGFCKPEAMMSGSIVGTPIHMAPELFSGQYDNSVDVYAFGILFWYLCAGKVKLPQAFEQCQNKEHLWTSVRKGARPEKLPYFDEECWRLMESCWNGDPTLRPLLGVVEPTLQAIKNRFDKLHTLAQEYSLPQSNSNVSEPLVLEEELTNTSPYLNIEYPLMRR